MQKSSRKPSGGSLPRILARGLKVHKPVRIQNVSKRISVSLTFRCFHSICQNLPPCLFCDSLTTTPSSASYVDLPKHSHYLVWGARMHQKKFLMVSRALFHGADGKAFLQVSFGFRIHPRPTPPFPQCQLRQHRD